MHKWGVAISAPHRVLNGMGIKLFEFDSKQTLLNIESKHCSPLDECPYVKPFVVLVWQFISGSRKRGVTESNRDWKHSLHWLVRLRVMTVRFICHIDISRIWISEKVWKLSLIHI